MGLLPMDIDLLPPSDDRIFKLLLTAPEGKPALIDLISATLRRPVIDAAVRNNEFPNMDANEKSERLDVNCKIDDGTQVDLEMQASRIQEDADGGHKNLKGKSIYYLCDLHSSQPSKGLRRYDKLAQTYRVPRDRQQGHSIEGGVTDGREFVDERKQRRTRARRISQPQNVPDRHAI